MAHTVTERILEHKPTIIGNGFKSGGIFPWDPSAPTQARTDPSQIYLQDSNNEHTSPNLETEVNSNQLPLIENPMNGSSQFYDGTEGSSHPTNPEQVSSSAADLAHEDFKLPESNKFL